MPSTATRPKVTIVTVTRDDAGRLARAIASVGEQTCREIQYVVVDGDSKDGTRELLEGSGGAVADWVSEPDGGIYDAMNKGISLAKGEWVLFLGADDVLADPGVVARCVAKIERAVREGGPVALACGDVVAGDGRRFRSRLGPATLLRNTVHHQGAFYASGLFREFRYDARLALVADYELNLALYRRGARAVALGEVVSLCGAGGRSSRLENRVRSARELNAIRSRHVPRLANALLSGVLWLRTFARLALAAVGRGRPVPGGAKRGGGA